MSLVSYISSHFNRHKTLPPSLKTMRVIAVAGIAIATATLIVTLSILKGFEKEYKRTILDFNAHVVLMEAGESGDVDKATELIMQRKISDGSKKFRSDFRFLLPVWSVFDRNYSLFKKWHEEFSYRIPFDSIQEKLLNLFSPQTVERILPDFLVRWKQKVDSFTLTSVTGVTPFIYREGLAIAHGAIKGVVIKGIDAGSMQDVNPMRIDFAKGYENLDDALQANSIENTAIIGSALAKTLGIDLAKTEYVKLLVPTSSIEKGADNFVKLKVAGIFESGLYDYDAQFILMSIPEIRRLYHIQDDRLTGLELRLDDPEKAGALSDWLKEELPSSWRIVPWNELNADIFKAVEMEKRTFSIIMGMLVIVSAFNIIGVLVLMILIRMHEISVLRSLGMTQSQLRKVFTRGGLIIGVIGVFVGTVLGIGLSLLIGSFEIVKIAPEIYFLSRLPVEISPFICGVIAIFCIGVCYLTSWKAAGQLSKVPISEGLSGTY